MGNIIGVLAKMGIYCWEARSVDSDGDDNIGYGADAFVYEFFSPQGGKHTFV